MGHETPNSAKRCTQMEVKSFSARLSPPPPPPLLARIHTGQREDRYETLSTRACVISELFPHWTAVPVQWQNVNPQRLGVVFSGSIKALLFLPVPSSRHSRRRPSIKVVRGNYRYDTPPHEHNIHILYEIICIYTLTVVCVIK